MNVFSPLIIQVIHFSRKRSLNGLFKQTSRGWTRLVRPPGITAVAVLFSRSCCFTVSVRWALNESQTSKLWVFANPPGRARQTFSIQILIYDQTKWILKGTDNILMSGYGNKCQNACRGKLNKRLIKLAGERI